MNDGEKQTDSEIVVQLPPDASLHFLKFVEAADVSKTAAFSKMVRWFLQEEEYLAPYYTCYRRGDASRVSITVSEQTRQDLLYLSQLGNSSAKNVAYTVIIVFLARPEINTLISSQVQKSPVDLHRIQEVIFK